MSWDNNNLACILVFPPWQRKGLGQILMGVSYELSKREGRLGGPEKREQLITSFLPLHTTKPQLNPSAALSDLGRLGYQAFWASTLARTILAACPAEDSTSPTSAPSFTVNFLSEETFILPEDIVATLQAMQVLDRRRSRGSGVGAEQVAVNKERVRRWAAENRSRLEDPVEGGAFVNIEVEDEDDEDDEDDEEGGEDEDEDEDEDDDSAGSEE